jgi:hypothetical protein
MRNAFRSRRGLIGCNRRESTERRDATMLTVELLDQPTMPVLAIVKIG